MAAVFKPNRSLLNSKFDSYKLDAINHDDVIASFPLTYKLSQIAPSAKSPLTLQEVQSRIRHNHLCIGPDGRAVYIDSELKVIGVDIDDAKLVPSYQVLYELPRQIQSDETDAPHREYPSAVFLDAKTLFVSDGTGTLYALQLQADGSAQLLNSFELSMPEQYSSAHPSVPFRLHSAVRAPSGQCTVLLSSRHYSNIPPSEESTSTKHVKPLPRFDIWAVFVDLDVISQDQPIGLDIVWHKRGANVPSYIEYIEEKNAFLLLGSSSYRPLSSPHPPSYQPTSDEAAPIPRADENFDKTAAANSVPKPPPYSWTQTSDQVTIAFPLPSTTPKDAIKVTFSPTTITVLVASSDEDTTTMPVPLPHYSLQKLWAPIQSSTSLWTFDRSAEYTYGLLTLHIDKQHEDTRWPQVFAPAPGTDSVDVPETLDPTELYQIREALEKYTSALQSGEDASGLGLGRGMPSLAEGELDEEVDLDTGDVVSLTWAALDGTTPPWAATGEDAPFSVLSTPLPGTRGIAPRPSLVVKTGLDGAVYTLDLADGAPAWTHTSTFCVLSFVLASKRDTRFVHHVASKAVFAFESGARGMGCNVYVYQNTARPTDKSAKQCILKINDGTGGPLLGVGMTHTKGGRAVILCLCEGELIVMHDILRDIHVSV